MKKQLNNGFLRTWQGLKITGFHLDLWGKVINQRHGLGSKTDHFSMLSPVARLEIAISQLKWSWPCRLGRNLGGFRGYGDGWHNVPGGGAPV